MSARRDRHSDRPAPRAWGGAVLAVALGVAAGPAAAANIKVTVDLTPAGLRNVTSPDQAMGAGIDGA
ncbi:hypothetical protein, partial [Phenylobacterium aquaticum]